MEPNERTERIGQWIEQYANRLIRLAYTYTRTQSAAEDCVQDSFIKAYRSMDRFKEGSDPFPWLAKIVVNECRMSCRRTMREIVMDWLPEPGWMDSTEETYLRSENEEALYQAILELPEPMRNPIILLYFEELSIEQISDILGQKTGTVKSRLARGRERLKKMVEGR